jgi:hypothetical protein
MFHITTDSVTEAVTVTGKVPAHPAIQDCTLKHGTIVFRPDTVQARFQRGNATEPWHTASVHVDGPDVLKSGSLSEKNRRGRGVELNPRWIERDEGSLALFAWARDWATIMLARINEIAERADFESDIALGDPVDLDALDDAVCVVNGEENPEHEWTPGDIECRRCGADLSAWNDDDSDAL